MEGREADEAAIFGKYRGSGDCAGVSADGVQRGHHDLAADRHELGQHGNGCSRDDGTHGKAHDAEYSDLYHELKKHNRHEKAVVGI